MQENKNKQESRKQIEKAKEEIFELKGLIHAKQIDIETVKGKVANKRIMVEDKEKMLLQAQNGLEEK